MFRDFKKSIAEDLDLVSKRKKDGRFNHLRLRYPEDHTDDYVGVIRRLELAVGENIQLNSGEFDQYIRNKWAWRESFLSTNSFYSQISGAYQPFFGTGSCYAVSSSWSISGSYALTSSYSLGTVGLGTTKPNYKLNVKDSSELDF